MRITEAVRPAPRGTVRPLSRTPDSAPHTIPEDVDPIDGIDTRLSARRARIFAHRGASGLFPEHTRAAYMRGLAEGADGLEIDLHLTRDGEAVCFHDATLERTTDGHGAVADVTLADMRALDISSWKTPKLPAHYGGAKNQLMALQDVLELLICAGRDTSLAVEFKHPSPYGHRLEERALEVLLAYGWDPETSQLRAGEHTVDISFMSFSPGSIMHLSELVPAEKLCALFTHVTDRAVAKRLAHMRFSAAVRPVVAAVMRGTVKDSEALIWNRQAGIAGPGVEYVHQHKAEAKAWIARGSRMRVWTVNSAADAEMLIGLGVQELTSDYPARLLRAVSVRSESGLLTA